MSVDIDLNAMCDTCGRSQQMAQVIWSPLWGYICAECRAREADKVSRDIGEFTRIDNQPCATCGQSSHVEWRPEGIYTCTSCYFKRNEGLTYEQIMAQ